MKHEAQGLVHKILLVGSDKIYAIENYFAKHFAELGVQVVHFPAQRYFYDYYQHSIFNKIFFKLGASRIFKQINKQFLRLVKQESPEIILVFKGMELFPASILKAKQTGAMVANYNPDNPFLFSGRGSGNSNVTAAIPTYDIHITYSSDIEAELKAKTQSKVFVVPFGFELHETLFERAASEPEKLKSCFLGNPDKFRARDILYLASKGLEIDVYGHGWKAFVQHENIKVFDAVYGEDFWLILRRYRVQLNLMRVHNETSHNMRTFEIPAIGGIMLAPNTPEHLFFFKEGIECFFYQNLDECLQKSQYILNIEPHEAETLRSNARRRSITSGYSYKDRAAEILKSLIDAK